MAIVPSDILNSNSKCFILNSMPLMTVFEPLFLLLAAAALITLAAALAFAATGRLQRARRLGWRLLMSAAVYMSIVIVVSAFTPRAFRQIGEQICFEDWCVTVQHVARETPTTFLVSLRLSSRARRVPQGERGTNLYIVDGAGLEYAPVSVQVPFDHLLQPGESIEASRTYSVPPDATALTLVYRRDRGFPIGSFIIGENRWFHGVGVHVRIP